ncbi:Aste57867_25436 [Aphanomyces stellatus]|uniref:Aste57867_25436 protein n=1 Tax=Aphanomyces stellatus TaxID=120398 RepID=A0A485LT75_9STRA|nr:hypothetical protein As57867_025357 [Aphanomyces stellatus]VFU02059.1 Aste57867_25436 [Aphanomyces stellatus]
MTTLVLQSSLFVAPQFYCFPWKPLINAAIGDSYAVALKHFLVNHMTASNLALHFVCLIVQLTGNFCLLRVLDDLFFPSIAFGPLSVSTFVVWVGYLVLNSTSAPLWAQLASTWCLGAAVVAAPIIVPHGELMSLALVGMFLSTLALCFLGGFRHQLNVRAATFGSLFLVAIHGGWYYLPQYIDGALLQAHLFHVNLVFGVVMFILSMVKNPLLPTVAYGYFVGRALATLTGQSWLFFFSYGFFGSVLQGFSHLLASEIPTLIALQKESPADKIRYEYAHVVFFPNLAFHGIDIYRLAAGKSQKSV